MEILSAQRYLTGGEDGARPFLVPGSRTRGNGHELQQGNSGWILGEDVLRVVQPCGRHRRDGYLHPWPSMCAWHPWAAGEGGDCAPLPRSAETPRESCAHLWSPQHRTELELLERGQRRPQQ